MPIECVWRQRRPTWRSARPGDCCWGNVVGFESLLSKHYLANVVAHRKPIIVHLQDRTNPAHVFPFWIDSHPSDDPAAAWDVTVDLASLVVGQTPNITVAPSIDCRGAYHGFLQGGVLTDDLG